MCISSNNMLSASSYRQREREWYYPQNLMLVVRVLFLCFLFSSINRVLFDERNTSFACPRLFFFFYPAVINYSIISFFLVISDERKVYDILRLFEFSEQRLEDFSSVYLSFWITMMIIICLNERSSMCYLLI